MQPAAKHFDPITGVDVHIVLIPTPGGPIPTPLPHPFVGMLWDIPDYVPFIGSTILVNGSHRSIAGTAGKGLPPHIPLGGPFAKPAASECEMFMGSSTVVFDGEAASYMALPSVSCQDIGSPPPFRANPKKKTKLKTLVLPSSVVLPISSGPPVLIGGAPTISMTALGMKVGFKALGKGLNKLKSSKLTRKALDAFKDVRQKSFKKLKPGFLKCKVLRAEPVNAVTGEVTVEQEDFSLPWRIPLAWTRCYGSQLANYSTNVPGWETPADSRLELALDGSVLFFDGTLGATSFERLPGPGEVVLDPFGGAELHSDEDCCSVRAKAGHRFHFARPTPERPAWVERVTDPSDNAISFHRNGRGLYAIRESSGLSIRVESNNHRIERMTLAVPGSNEEHFLAEYRYDDAGRLAGVRARDSAQPLYRFAYNDAGRLISHTDRNGLSFHYQYAHDGDDWKCVHSWGDGGLYDYRFDYRPGETRFVDSLGHETLLRYGEDFLPFEERDPLGASTYFEYDEQGRTTRVVDAYGAATEYAYDERGNVAWERDAEGHEMRRDFDDRGRLTGFVDPRGGAWSVAWNDRDQVVARKSALGHEHQYRYDVETGDLSASTDPRGNETRYEYDRHGTLTAIVDALDRRQELRVSPLGDVERLAEPGGRTTSYAYTRAGRLRSVTRPSGARTHLRYDHEGNLTEYRDARDLVTRFRYVGLGELAERTSPDGTSVVYDYDTEERLRSVRNERRETYSFERDAIGRVTKTTDYWGAETRYAYDAVGNIVCKVDPFGETTTYEYDRLGQMVAAAYPDGQSEEVSYDPWGNGVAFLDVQHPEAIVERVYDLENRLTREIQGEHWVEYDYDESGNRVGQRSSLGNELGYEYDELDRLSAIRDEGRGRELVGMRYDGRGDRVEEQLVGGMVRRREFGDDGDLLGQVLIGSDGLITSRSFEYDREGNLTARKDSEKGTQRFEYDPCDRLRKWTSPSGVVSEFVRDPAGSLLADVPSPKASRQRRMRHGGCRYTFDAAGRLAERRVDERFLQYEWDGRNRLARCREDGHATAMSYDSLGRRRQKSSDDHQVDYVWDGDRLLGELSVETKEYLVEPKTFGPIGYLSAGGVVHFETDQAGHVHETFAEDGASLWSAQFDGHGAVVSEESPVASNNLLGAGLYADPETGLYYCRYRYVIPEIHSFASQDPIGLHGGEDTYSRGPNPWSWVDPTGLQCVHSKYADGTDVLKGDRPPKIKGPDPDASGSHSVLMWDEKNRRIYKAREYDAHGNPVRDIDFTNPTFPNGTPRPGHPGPPHQHRYHINDPRVGPKSGFKRGGPEPLM